MALFQESPSPDASFEALKQKRRQLLLLETSTRLLLCILEEGAGENHNSGLNLSPVISADKDHITQTIDTYTNAQNHLIEVVGAAIRKAKFTEDTAVLLRRATSDGSGSFTRGNVDLESFIAELREVLKYIRNGS